MLGNPGSSFLTSPRARVMVEGRRQPVPEAASRPHISEVVSTPLNTPAGQAVTSFEDEGSGPPGLSGREYAGLRGAWMLSRGAENATMKRNDTVWPHWPLCLHGD